MFRKKCYSKIENQLDLLFQKFAKLAIHSSTVSTNIQSLEKAPAVSIRSFKDLVPVKSQPQEAQIKAWVRVTDELNENSAWKHDWNLKH